MVDRPKLERLLDQSKSLGNSDSDRGASASGGNLGFVKSQKAFQVKP